MAAPTDVSFHWADYLVFAVFLVASAGIGVIYGFKSRGTKNAKDFLTGGGEMHYAPVSLSMMASFMSAIFVLSIPAEMYIYGTTYAYLILSYFTGFTISAHVYLPIYYELKVTSGYQYLEMRFNRVCRVAGSITFSVMMFLYMGVVLYTPVLSLSQVSGMPMEITLLAVGLVVTFYTALGGMKATIWNDALQMLIILLGFVLLVALGSAEVGGFSYAWERAEAGGRLRFNVFDPTPFTRLTFWTVVVGGTFNNITLYASSQTVIQKFISTKSVRDGQIAVWLSTFSTSLYMILVMFIGCIMYAYYEHCDPLAAEYVEKKDQVVILFVMEVMGHLHGLPGLYLATAFAATLSTVSGGVNAMAAVFLEDIISPLYKYKTGEYMTGKTATLVTRGLAVLFGLLTIALSFVTEYMGALVIQVALSIFGMVGSPLAGMISLGMFVPCANSWGAMIGLLTSLGLTCWIGIGAIVEGVVYPELPVSTDGCDVINATTMSSMWSTMESIETTADTPGAEYLKIYELSYMLYPLFAMLVVIIVGIPVSLITGGNKELQDQDPRLFYSFARRWCCCCPGRCVESCSCGARDVDQEYDLSHQYDDSNVLDMTEKSMEMTVDATTPSNYKSASIKSDSWSTAKGDDSDANVISYWHNSSPKISYENKSFKND